MTTWSLDAGQGPLGSLVVKVKVKVPVLVPGSKFDDKLVGSTMDPVVEVHTLEVADAPMAPEREANCPTQTEMSAPAFTVGAAFTFTVETAVTVQPKEV
jgi:hypothetical protein